MTKAFYDVSFNGERLMYVMFKRICENKWQIKCFKRSSNWQGEHSAVIDAHCNGLKERGREKRLTFGLMKILLQGKNPFQN